MASNREETIYHYGSRFAQPTVAFDIEAPCFYDVERLADEGHRITYWLFYPTSTLPRWQWERLIGVLAAAGIAVFAAADADDAQLTTPLLPPNDDPGLVDPAQVSAVDAFFEAELKPGEVAAWSPWGAMFGGDAANYLLKQKNPIARAFGAGAAGIATLYDLMSRIVVDSAEDVVTAPMEAVAEVSRAVDRIAHRRYIHEGDWEAVTVELDAHHDLRRVLYWGHGHPIVRDARTATTDPEESGLHPVAFVAVGSHASFPDRETASDAHELVTHPRRTGIWRTWRNLRPAPQQGVWYGFGGAWGRARLAPVGRLRFRYFKQIDLWKESTGPLGPGPLKLAQQATAVARVDRKMGHNASPPTDVLRS